MIRISLVAAVTAGALALVASVSAQSSATKLTGTVGPGFTISLKDAKGKKVTSLKAGSYTIAVSDKSGIHNYVIEGPGVAKNGGNSVIITSTPFTGSKSKTLTFKKGKTYTYVCTPHRNVPTMRGTFKVS